MKPELAAPGVNITTTAAGGGYTVVSGTSFAAPFVTGSAALLMEYGIVRKNDPYLYGDKLKAYLLAGARSLRGTVFIRIFEWDMGPYVQPKSPSYVKAKYMQVACY